MGTTKTSAATTEIQLAEALAYSAALAEVLMALSRIPPDLQAVFETIVDNAVRLCRADNASLLRASGDVYREVAHAGEFKDPEAHLRWAREQHYSPGRGQLTSRILLERRTVQIEDIRTDPDYDRARSAKAGIGARTMLGVPILRADALLGIIIVRRSEVRLFDAREIDILETFAQQAAIAIENVRLFNDTKEALEQQSAVSEVLQVVSRSAFDLPAVLQTVLDNAVRLCDAQSGSIFRLEGDVYRIAATSGTSAEHRQFWEAHPILPGRETVIGRAALEGRGVQIADVLSDPEYGFKESARQFGFLTNIGVPMQKDGRPIGAFALGRSEVRAFNEREIRLAETFADQAAIAIENVRLFNETKESLDRQTATSEVLRAISQARDDVRPVLTTIVTAALRLCAADSAGFFRREGDEVVLEATAGDWPREARAIGSRRPLKQQGWVGLAFIERQTFHVPDMAAEDVRARMGPSVTIDEWTKASEGARSRLVVPVIHDAEAIGVIRVQRAEPGGFTPRQIELVESFAAQAAIAIENVRLFNETKEALEQQTAIAGVLEAINKSRFDQQPVLQELVDRAAHLCDSGFSSISLWDGSAYVTNAWSGAGIPPEYVNLMIGERRRPDRSTLIGRTGFERRTVHVLDVLEDPEYRAIDMQRAAGYRTMLGVPLMRDGFPIGVFALTRGEVRPFSDREIQLVETFAQQAVIAIENVRLFNETKEALDQQVATAQVLTTISRSAFDLQAVFDVVVENATRLCRGDWGYLFRRDGGLFHIVSSFGGSAELVDYERAHPTPLSRSTLIGRVALDGEVVHIPDLFEDQAYDWPSNRAAGVHTVLGVPIFKADEVVGAIGVARNDRRPFSDAEIRLVRTFADQAAIAMENVRLFNETKEALERQTAIGEILRVMSNSPTDVQPVLDAIAKSASEFCAAPDVLVNLLDSGDQNRIRAHHGNLAVVPQNETGPFSDRSVSGRAMLERRTIHLQDLQAEVTRYPGGAAASPTTRAISASPLLRMGRPIGAIILRRSEATPFTERQIELAETFADQAAIAIENVRLFNETKESLDRQTALAEILRVIASSPSDQQPVFDAIAINATRYCGAEDAVVLLVLGDEIVWVAHHGPILTNTNPNPSFLRTSVIGRAILDGHTVHVADITGPAGDEFPSARLRAAEVGDRGILATPLLREATAIGAILLRKMGTSGFTPSQIQLVEAFADQAVIAIENVRLFKETKEALERQTAISEILRAIAKSPSDELPVLQAIAESATRFCGAGDATVLIISGDELVPVAHHGPIPTSESTPLKFDRTALSARAMMELRTLHVSDILGPDGDQYPQARARHETTKQRALLAAPLVREGAAIGAILLRKLEPVAFTPNQIALVEAFADQAVIAIENVRLFNETKEALERQTATSSILNVISRSPADQQPTLDAIVESGARLCDAEMSFIYVVEQGFFKLRAGYRVPPGFADFTNANPVPVTPHRGSLSGRVVAEGRAVQIPDVLGDTEYTYLEAQRLVGYRAMLNVPMFSKGELIGLIGLWRTAPVPFTTQQIDLMSTFADQAVIAIENTRLFNETKEALEQQTAVSEVLKTISRSAFDLQPVLDIVLDNAVRLASADIGWLSRVEDQQFMTVAYSSGFPQHVRDELVQQRVQGHVTGPWIPVGDRGGVMGLTLAEGRTVHVPDVRADEQLKGSVVARLSQSRTVIGVPMLREGQAIGGMVLARYEVRPFSAREIELVQTFADQAAIAIGNVRLFNDIQDKSRQLEVASRHKSEFLANMSHELRTPLNAIIGFSEVLLQGIFGGVNEKQREYLSDVLGSGQHLLSLINDILDLAKIEAGRMDLEISTFALRDALESGLTIVRDRAARHGIQLSTAVASDIRTIEADERKVKQILYNLLSNAVKFTPDGGRVDVSVRAENGDVRVEVRDTGIGVAAGDQERIFQEFRQVGRERSREGTGLGLTLTKRFVELHGGRIWLESSPGKGSTFAFTLPVRRAAAVNA